MIGLEDYGYSYVFFLANTTPDKLDSDSSPLLKTEYSIANLNPGFYYQGIRQTHQTSPSPWSSRGLRTRRLMSLFVTLSGDAFTRNGISLHILSGIPGFDDTRILVMRARSGVKQGFILGVPFAKSTALSYCDIGTPPNRGQGQAFTGCTLYLVCPCCSRLGRPTQSQFHQRANLVRGVTNALEAESRKLATAVVFSLLALNQIAGDAQRRSWTN